jgi:hypothetical protein
MRTSELLNLASYRLGNTYFRDTFRTMQELRSISIFPQSWRALLAALMLAFVTVAVPARAEQCKMGSDLDAATQSALDKTAQNYYQMASASNTAGLKEVSIPTVAADFGGIESAIAERKADFGTSATVRNTYELDAPGSGPITRAEFFCGIQNSPDFVDFVIPNLPAGRYGLVILDAQGGKQGMTVSFVLQQYSSGRWKLAGFYARPSSLAGHDGNWYLAQARSYKAKGQNHAAWLYYLAAWDLLAPVPFMSTGNLEKVGEEAQSAKPPDMPTPEQPLKLTGADGKTYNLTSLFAVPVSDGLGLVVKFQVPDVSNTGQAYQENIAVMKDLLMKYPELREAFTSIVARATAPGGQDYGTLQAMKDVK